MVKIAFMGAGGIAERMAPTLTGMIFEGDQSICRYAVAARELDRARRFAQKHGFEKAYGSYDEMLEDGEVDLVYIATPHSHHYEHIKKCLAHGKHVLCEKAFTVNAAQAREVLALAEEKRLLLTEAMWTRYMPSMKIIKEIMDSGEIGKPMTICGNLSANLQHVARMTDPALAGGVLLDEGVYVLTIASMLFGDDYKEICGTAVLDKNGLDTQDSITLCYEDGRMAVLNASMVSIGDRRFVVYGEKGCIVSDSVNNPQLISVYDDSRTGIPTRNIRVPRQITGYEYEIKSCVRAIERGETECPEMPHAETVRMLEIMDSLREKWGIRYPCE